PSAAKRSATVSVTDSSPVVSIVKAKDASEVNGDTTGRALFVVSRTGNVSMPLTVLYSVDVPASTATSGADFTALAGSVVIPAGQSSAAIVLRAIDDMTAEGPEPVIVNLTAHMAYNL